MQRIVCFSVTIFSAALVAVTVGCDRPESASTPGQVTSDDVRRDTGKAVDTAAEFAQQSKEEFESKLDARLKQLDAEIVRLREKGSELKDEAKVRWDEKLTQLETKREAARVKLAEVKDSSAEAWKDLQKGAQAAWVDLDKAFQDASGEF